MDSLPPELMCQILMYVEPVDAATVMSVDSRCKDIVSSHWFLNQQLLNYQYRLVQPLLLLRYEHLLASVERITASTSDIVFENSSIAFRIQLLQSIMDLHRLLDQGIRLKFRGIPMNYVSTCLHRNTPCSGWVELSGVCYIGEINKLVIPIWVEKTKIYSVMMIIIASKHVNKPYQRIHSILKSFNPSIRDTRSILM